jgi:hypothetical protein
LNIGFAGTYRQSVLSLAKNRQRFLPKSMYGPSESFFINVSMAGRQVLFNILFFLEVGYLVGYLNYLHTICVNLYARCIRVKINV